MKEYKDYMDNISVSDELHRKIMEKATKTAMPVRFAYALPLALCAIVAISAIAAAKSGVLRKSPTSGNSETSAETDIINHFVDGQVIIDLGDDPEPYETPYTTEVTFTSPPSETDDYKDYDYQVSSEQIILRDIIDECDSIAALVEAHPEFKYAYSFYEGDRFAYMKHHIENSLYQVFFEDYRTGKAYLIEHSEGDSFSEFFFEQDIENDPLNTGRLAKARNLGEKGTLEDFRRVAFEIGREILPAELDYTEYIDKDGYMDLDAIVKYAYDKDRMLDEMYLYYAFYRDFTVEQPDSVESYWVNDRDYLKKFFDFYFALDYEVVDTRFLPDETEHFDLHIFIGGWDNMRYFRFGTDGDSYYYVSSPYGSKYLTREQYDRLREWVKPVLEQQEDLAPLG